MTVKDAEIAYNCVISYIVVSNHGGRVLDHTPGIADVLPEITARVKGKMTIIADKGVRSRTDVLKLLAFGADAFLLEDP
jgi:isopentenyl diphosphate isomerase/L-lactate dehydrogenase-like FMN-dependent dehydrogenase